MISQSRWEQIICEVKFVSELHLCITKEESDAVVSVLKNNTPFQVVPDCCLVKTPSKATIEAMNDDAILDIDNVISETNNILLETQHFKVLGDKE